MCVDTHKFHRASTTSQNLEMAKESRKREITMSLDKSQPNSPKWSPTIKMIVGLTITGLIVAMLIYFRSIIGPLLLAFILVYLLHPLTSFLHTHSKLSWRWASTIIFILLIILLLISFTLLGLAAVQQIQSLIVVVERYINNLPAKIDAISQQVIIIGPYRFDLSQFTDLGQLGDQVISTLQLFVGRAGNVVGTLASATASLFGWGLFVLVITYFVLADIGKVPNLQNFLNIPGYSYDIQKMSSSIGRIWNAFLRGQLTVVILVIISYFILLSILGVRYAFALAILAGLARFVPYIGPLITYIVMGLVTLFQGGNYFNLQPVFYTALVIILSIIMDQIYDNLVVPRIMGRSLGVHPAAVLVVAIIAANLIGLIGLLLAAPVLATVNLVGRYTLRKMFDRDPWLDTDNELVPLGFPRISRLINKISEWWKFRQNKETRNKE
jgi:predicted PurR-regulated permease PerM